MRETLFGEEYIQFYASELGRHFDVNVCRGAGVVVLNKMLWRVDWMNRVEERIVIR